MYRSAASKHILGTLLISFLLSSHLFAAHNDTAFRIDTIRVSGNKKTKTHIILRELSFRQGDTIQNWDYHKDQSRKQLINLFLFNEIEISRDSSTVFVHVTERWYIWPIPQLDYADRNFNQWWLTRDPGRLIYGVNLEWYNVRGRGEYFEAGVLDGYTKMLSLRYRMPYINKKQTWGVQASVHYSANREVWFRTSEDRVQFFRDRDLELIRRIGGELAWTHRKKFFSYHHIYSGYRHIDISDTVSRPEVNDRYLLNGRIRQDEVYAGYQFAYDKRDYKGYPLEGTLIRLTAESSVYQAPSEPGGKFATVLFRASGSKYKHFGGNWYGSGHLSMRYFSNPDPPYSRVQALGYGKDYIRGYELFVVDGSHFGLAKSELRYRLHHRKYRFLSKVRNYEVLPVSVFLSSFFDAGYVWNFNMQETDKNMLPNTIQHGGGGGLNLVLFYDYCMRIEYSFNRMMQSRFYVSFVASM